MTLSKGINVRRYENKVCKVKKSICGLKQSGQVWNTKLDETLNKNELEKIKFSNYVYHEKFKESRIIIIHTDGLVSMASNKKLLEQRRLKRFEKLLTS